MIERKGEFERMRNLMRLNIYLMLLLLFFIQTAFASESPYIKEGTIGTSNKTYCNQGEFVDKTFECLVGERVVFLPKSPDYREEGYTHVRTENGYAGVPYDEIAGKTGLVTEVLYEEPYFLVKVQADNGKIYIADGVSCDYIFDIALVSDIESAKKKYLGNVIWFKGSKLLGYDAYDNKYFNVQVRRFSPVKVVAIVASWSSYAPVRFVLSDEKGKEGFVDLQMSQTNVDSNFRKLFTFDKVFFEKDPRKTYRWSADIWDLIEHRKVTIGMSKKQAELSWGKPKEINRSILKSTTQEQWVYSGGRYLYFESDKITSIQDKLQ